MSFFRLSNACKALRFKCVWSFLYESSLALMIMVLYVLKQTIWSIFHLLTLIWHINVSLPFYWCTNLMWQPRYVYMNYFFCDNRIINKLFTCTLSVLSITWNNFMAPHVITYDEKSDNNTYWSLATGLPSSLTSTIICWSHWKATTRGSVKLRIVTSLLKVTWDLCKSTILKNKQTKVLCLCIQEKP